MWYFGLFLISITMCVEGFVVMQTAGVNPARPQSWSNRQGITLTPITTGVWAAERPFIWNNIDVGSRSTIARMADGSLMVHSPVEWDEQLRDCLESLGGGVGHVVAPNYEHLKYTKQWAEKYPSVKMYACPGLPARMPEVSFAHELPNVPQSFSDNLDLCWMDSEINPFTGRPFFNEVVFFHKKSKSLMCADAFWNYPAGEYPNYNCEGDDTGRSHECPKMPAPQPAGGRLPSVEVPLGTRAWKFGMDVIYAPFYRSLMVGRGERRAKYEEAVRKILAWDIECIIPCHGDVIRGRQLCSNVLRKHFLPLG